jgi:ubiquinone/menaquinone biosynthesis C-methylase UbiE
MLRTRDDVYQPGLPARAGEHYRAFVRFAARHAGERVLDLGRGYGAYSLALLSEGRRCVGSDINLQYLKTAVSAGLPVVAAEGCLPFPDQSFDTVLLFEVIEHVPQIRDILKEAFRVARKNVLITVPNAEDDSLKGNDVTYAHMLSSDHVHFFDPQIKPRFFSRLYAVASVRQD